MAHVLNGDRDLFADSREETVIYTERLSLRLGYTKEASHKTEAQAEEGSRLELQSVEPIAILKRPKFRPC